MPRVCLGGPALELIIQGRQQSRAQYSLDCGIASSTGLTTSMRTSFIRILLLCYLFLIMVVIIFYVAFVASYKNCFQFYSAVHFANAMLGM